MQQPLPPAISGRAGRYRTTARFSVHPHPIACRDSTLWAFLLPADRGSLDRLVQRSLVDPTEGAVRYRALGAAAWLVFADMRRIGHTGSDLVGGATIAEREAAIWVPVVRLDGRGRVCGTSWFVPYMFVDSGIALSAGREIFGFPKELGRVQIDGEGGRFAVSAETVDRLDEGERAAWAPLVEVANGGAGAMAAGWRTLLATTPGEALALFRGMGDGRVPLTLLRQLPCIDDPREAAFIEVAEIDAIPQGRPRVTRMSGAWDVHLRDPDMHPLCRDLGVPADVRSPLAARIDLDFVLGTGKPIFRGSARVKRRRRLLVVGGGLASLTAVWELTRTPELARAWDITVVQPGWRLGGKTASSRDPRCAMRSEEHGLHVWFGFYRNAFRLLREVYDELDRPADHPLARPEQALVPQSRVHFHDRWKGRPCTWVIDYPGDGVFPGGDGAREGRLTALPRTRDLLRRGLQVLVAMLRGEPVMRHRTEGVDVPPLPWHRVARSFLGRGRLPLALLRLQRAAAALDAADALAGPVARRLERLIVDVRVAMREALGEPDAHHPDVVHLWIIAESGLAMALGVVRDDVARRGFDALDAEDLRDWLSRHGAPDPVLSSGPMRALYDASFSYADGDPSRPDLAAGAGLTTILRMVFTYEGAILWKASVGMGEAVIAPLYEALEARGVRFRFFHRVDRLELNDDGRRVRAVHATRQARVRGERYHPLIEVDGVGCWPSTPLQEQLVDGDALADLDPSWLESGVDGGPVDGAVTWEEAVDFDEILLGAGLGALPRMCGELVERWPRWRAALDGLDAVRTQAVQLWLTEGPDRSDGTEAIDNLVSADLPSWIDMQPVLAHERWGAHGPRRLVYGCGVLPGRVPAPEADQAVRERVEAVLEHHGHALCPDWSWDTLYDPEGREGPDRLGAQYLRANVHGSELYERAATGTAHLRLPPGRTEVDNLSVAGAWTRTGFHIGSVEAAVMSGRLTATALDGQPRHVVGASSTPNGES